MNSNALQSNQKEIDFDALESLDIFFSYDKAPVGAIIRIAEAGWNAIYDGRTVNHAGLIAKIEGQVFCAEVCSTGIRLNSIEKYRSDSNFISKVFRYYEFDRYEGRREHACKDLMLEVRRNQDKGYDFFGAFRSIPIINNLFHFFSNDPNKEFCSESVYDFLYKHGAIFPLSWLKYPPHPLALCQWLEKHPDIYKEIHI